MSNPDLEFECPGYKFWFYLWGSKKGIHLDSVSFPPRIYIKRLADNTTWAGVDYVDGRFKWEAFITIPDEPKRFVERYLRRYLKALVMKK